MSFFGRTGSVLRDKVFADQSVSVQRYLSALLYPRAKAR